MIENNRSKFFLGIFFSIALFSVNYANGMFNEQGQWICSQEIDIEINYYQSYTESFQNTINEVYFTDGAIAARSYFEFAIKEEVIGQDWKRSQDCLIELGVDITELSPIIIPTEETPDEFKPQIKPPEEDTEKLDPLEKIPPTEKFETETKEDSYYFGVVIIIIGAILGLAYFFRRSRNKYVDSKTISKDNESNDKTREKHYQNVEIEVQGGIEK